jgi:hypothetical protein
MMSNTGLVTALLGLKGATAAIRAKTAARMLTRAIEAIIQISLD